MIVYKVVHVTKDGRLISVMAEGKFSTTYEIGKATRCPVTNLGNPALLFAFDRIDEALRMLDNVKTGMLLECEGETEAYYASIDHTTEVDIERMWDKAASTKSTDVGLFCPPKATVFCKWIKPIKEVMFVKEVT